MDIASTEIRNKHKCELKKTGSIFVRKGSKFASFEITYSKSVS